MPRHICTAYRPTVFPAARTETATIASIAIIKDASQMVGASNGMIGVTIVMVAFGAVTGTTGKMQTIGARATGGMKAEKIT